MRQVIVAAALAAAACSAVAAEWQVTTASANNAHPSWCGDWIVFQSDRDTPGNYQIWMVSDQGELNPLRVTNDPTKSLREPNWNCAAQFVAVCGGAGGTDRIYYAYQSGPPYILVEPSQSAVDNESPSYVGAAVAFDSDREGQREIYLMAEGGEPYGFTRLTTNAADDADPAISPDGQRIAFSSSRAGDADIWITSTAGEQDLLEHVTATAERDGEPAWSPGGTHIAFARGGVGIVVVGVATRTEYAVTANGTDSSPAWSPEGDLIAFTRHGAYDQVWCSDNVPPGAPVERTSWGCVKALFR
jgi:TolB protein